MKGHVCWRSESRRVLMTSSSFRTGIQMDMFNGWFCVFFAFFAGSIAGSFAGSITLFFSGSIVASVLSVCLRDIGRSFGRRVSSKRFRSNTGVVSTNQPKDIREIHKRIRSVIMMVKTDVATEISGLGLMFTDADASVRI